MSIYESIYDIPGYPRTKKSRELSQHWWNEYWAKIYSEMIFDE